MYDKAHGLHRWLHLLFPLKVDVDSTVQGLFGVFASGELGLTGFAILESNCFFREISIIWGVPFAEVLLRDSPM